jgi:hypothetical protein
VHSTRQAPRSSPVHLRAIVAAVLALGLVLAIATLAWAAPSLTIDSGPAGPTRDTMPSFGFTADVGATVECSIDDGTPDYGPCSGAATHAPAAPLPDGDYVFRVRATDAGLEQTERSQPFSVDTVASLSIDSGPPDPTNDATPSFAFIAEAGASAECSIDHGTLAYVPCTSPFTAVAPLPEGRSTFSVRVTDALGNVAELSQDFVVDTVDPAVDVVSGPTGATRDRAPSLGFTVGDASATSVECSIDHGIPVYGPCTTATSHTAATLADGSYVFHVRARDAAGNQATASQPFSVDTVASLSIDSGPTGATRDSTPSFGFTAEAGASVECSIDQGTLAYVPCTSPFTAVAPLPEGRSTFSVRVTDTLGNEADLSRELVVDTVDPAVDVVSGPTVTSDRTPSFGFTVDDANATRVECSIDHGTPAYRPCSDVATHTPAAALPDDDYVLHVRATDAAGNQASDFQAFSVDSAVPTLSIDSGPAGPTNDATPSFGFTAEAGTTAECSIDQGPPAYAPCTSPFTPVAPLPDGTYTFSVRATDRAANVASEPRTFTVDTAPPSLSIDFGPSGPTTDSTPLFGFTPEAGATVACSIDQGAPAYGPCATAATHAAVAPLSDGAYVFRVRATDGAGNQASATRAFTVDTVPHAPAPESPRPDPTPPVTPPVTTPATPPVTPAPSEPRLLSPFPVVRISGTLTSTGARIRLLSVRAPSGALVRITVSPACSGKRRSSRRCRVLQAAGTVGRSSVIGFRGLARAYRSGTVIVVRVWHADQIGKYTRFTIVRGKAPRRVDQCLVPEATSGSRCPSI